MTQSKTVLRIDASARKAGSSSRALTDAMIVKLAPEKIITRDVADGLPFVTEDWVNANFTDEAERSDEQKAVLAESDALVEEIFAADTLVIGSPIYNFGVPATLKAWIDMIASPQRRFNIRQLVPRVC